MDGGEEGYRPRLGLDIKEGRDVIGGDVGRIGVGLDLAKGKEDSSKMTSLLI